MGMDVRWLLTRNTVGAEHSVLGITVFAPDVELGPGEVVFVPRNDYHGFENTGSEPVYMIWGYAGAASLEEAGYIRYDDDHPA
jgi:mannose-6-phosphate isomerase-like protein (cupin superfamily)